MKKILTVFDGANFSEVAFNFLNNQSSIKPDLLTGVFLSSIDFASVWGYPVGLGGYVSIVEGDYELMQKNIERFKSLCEKNGIDYRVHDDYGAEAIAHLIKETRFADLLIISGESFYRNTDGEEPGSYMTQTLHDSECPVLILPEDFEYPHNNLLAYDGSANAVFAIKQFSYIFPQWRGNKTYLLHAGGSDGIPHQIYIEELASRHFSNLTIRSLDFDAEKYFATWAADRKKSILVCGAYGRSGFSEWLNKSFVKDVIAEHQIPVFIAHK